MRGTCAARQQLERVATQIWDDLAVAPDERKLAGVLVRTLSSSTAPSSTRELAEVTTNWRLERLGVDRSLRASLGGRRAASAARRRRAS